MRHSEIAGRYAKALYQLSLENKNQEQVFEDLRGLQRILHETPGAMAYLDSPLQAPQKREKSFGEVLQDKGLSQDVVNFVLLLVRKDRLGILLEIISAFQNQIDSAHSVTRGTVDSAIALGPEDRIRLEAIVRKVTKKDVILTYKTNPKVIGGM